MISYRIAQRGRYSQPWFIVGNSWYPHNNIHPYPSLRYDQLSSQQWHLFLLLYIYPTVQLLSSTCRDKNSVWFCFIPILRPVFFWWIQIPPFSMMLRERKRKREMMMMSLRHSLSPKQNKTKSKSVKILSDTCFLTKISLTDSLLHHGILCHKDISWNRICLCLSNYIHMMTLSISHPYVSLTTT